MTQYEVIRITSGRLEVWSRRKIETLVGVSPYYQQLAEEDGGTENLKKTVRRAYEAWLQDESWRPEAPPLSSEVSQ